MTTTVFDDVSALVTTCFLITVSIVARLSSVAISLGRSHRPSHRWAVTLSCGWRETAQSAASGSQSRIAWWKIAMSPPVSRTGLAWGGVHTSPQSGEDALGARPTPPGDPACALRHLRLIKPSVKVLSLLISTTTAPERPWSKGTRALGAGAK